MHVVAAGVTALYGLISIVGGLMGYAKGSTISLVAGGAAGILLLLCAAGAFRAPVWAFGGGIILSLLLVGRFTSSLITHRDRMSEHLSSTIGIVGIIMIVIGALVVFFSGLALATESRPPTVP
jgi:uncharacterized membrane protein (UPF0136 family)